LPERHEHDITLVMMLIFFVSIDENHTDNEYRDDRNFDTVAA